MLTGYDQRIRVKVERAVVEKKGNSLQAFGRQVPRSTLSVCLSVSVSVSVKV